MYIIQNVHISANVLHLTVDDSTGLSIGESILIDGVTNAAFLNGAIVQIISPLTTTDIYANYTYAGDWPAGSGSGSDTGTVTPVVSTATTTSLTSSVSPSFFEDQLTFSISVAGSGPTPTGTVLLTDTLNGHTTTLGTLNLDGSGNASFVTNALNPGIHTIIATYSGDAMNLTSSHTLLQQVVEVVEPSSVVSGFGLIATYSAQGDTNLTPSAQIFTVPVSASPGESVTILWDVLNVPVIRITGDIDSFDTGFITTNGQGAYVVGNGFTATIVLTLAAYDITNNPIIVNNVPLVTSVSLPIS